MKLPTAGRGNDQFAPGWRIVAKDPSLRADPRVRTLVDEAWAAAPDGILNESVVEMLPRKPIAGRRHLCGDHGPLARQHIPCKSPDNKRWRSKA